MSFESDNEFCYYIEAITLSSIVRSNIACDKQQTLIFIPSGFVANTINQFKPDGSFISINNYKLQVYNRWGIKVFESIDKNIGWDGANAATGTYIYVIDYQIHTGEIFEKRGWLTLLR